MPELTERPSEESSDDETDETDHSIEVRAVESVDEIRDTDHGYTRAEAHLFANGNAMFFDENGKQIGHLQGLGIGGVHEFTRAYPAADVFWSIWRDGGIDEAVKIHDNLLTHIREPAERPDGSPPHVDERAGKRPDRNGPGTARRAGDEHESDRHDRS